LEELAVRPPLVAVKPPWNIGWWSDQPLVAVRPPGLSRLPENQFFNEGFSKEFNDSNLYGPRRRKVVLTQNSHKNKKLKQSGNYRLIK
jgi:hypothetical protein